MALADNDLLIVQKPATKLHYKIKVADLIPDTGSIETPSNLVHVGETAPADPHEGDLWFKPNGDPKRYGVLYLYYVTPTTGVVDGVTIRGGGSGYSVADNVPATGGGGHELSLNITSVDSSGKITGLSVNNGGHGYEVGDVAFLFNNGHGNGSVQVRSVSSVADGEWISLMDGGDDYE